MIDQTLKFLKHRLHQSVRQHADDLGHADDHVALSNIHELDGSVSKDITDKLVLSFVKADRDASTGRPPLVSKRAGDGVFEMSRAPLCLDIYFLLAANFANYETALRYLSQGVTFFQANSLFDRQATPDLPPRIEKLDIQVENTSIHELNNLWGMLGGKLLPSMLYKVRIVALASDQVIAEFDQVRGTNVEGAT